MKLFLSLVALLSVTFTSMAQYKLQILGGGNHASTAYDINNFGFAVGYHAEQNGVNGVIWDQDGSGWPLFSSLEDSLEDSAAYTINDDFLIGGGSGTFEGNTTFPIGGGTAIVWVYIPENNPDFFTPIPVLEGNGTIRDIDSLGNFAGDKNDFGVTGNLYDTNLFKSSVRGSVFYGVSQGNPVGTEQVAGATPFAFAGTYNKMEANGNYTLTTSVSALGVGNGHVTKALKVNTNSQVVVIREHVGAYVWNPLTGASTFLGSNTAAYDLSNIGVVVGSTNGRACKWEKVGNALVCIDLNTLVSNPSFILEVAYGINDKGQIVGQGLDTTTGVLRAFLLTIVPQINSHIRVTQSGKIEVSWPAEKDASYSIQTSGDLKTWKEKATHTASVAGPATWSCNPSDASQLFVKVVLTSP